MFDKILIPFDGSNHAMWSLQNAIELGKLYKSEIIVFHSVRHYFRVVKKDAFYPTLGISTAMPITPIIPKGEEPWVTDSDAEEQLFQSQKELGERLLAEAKKRVDDAGLKCETILAEYQEPVETAKELVEKRGIDLVIVGARGVHNAAERMLLGSVSSGIVNHVCTNIMIMRSECPESHGQVPTEQPKKHMVKGKSS